MAWQRFVVGRSLSATLIRALLIALTLLLTSQYVIGPVRGYGISMQPTVDPGAWLWLSAWHTFDGPRRAETSSRSTWSADRRCS